MRKAMMLLEAYLSSIIHSNFAGFTGVWKVMWREVLFFGKEYVIEQHLGLYFRNNKLQLLCLLHSRFVSNKARNGAF
jgi:hypothetical protein